MNKKFIGLILFIVVLFLPSAILGVESIESTTAPEIKYENVNPGSDFSYNFKRLREKITLFILGYFPDRKIQFLEKLLDTRLAEYKYVVDKKDIANLQTSSQRYFTTAGELTDFVTQNSSLSSKKEEVKEILQKNLLVIRDLKGKFNDTTAEWRFVKHTSDYIEIYMARL